MNNLLPRDVIHVGITEYCWQWCQHEDSDWCQHEHIKQGCRNLLEVVGIKTRSSRSRKEDFLFQQDSDDINGGDILTTHEIYDVWLTRLEV